MRYVFVINPVAGKGNGVETVKPLVEKYFAEHGGDYKIYVTSGEGEAKSIAENEAKTGDDVVVFGCGGEGTGFEVLNGIQSYPNASFGIVPCGSANDFLKLFESKEPFVDIDSQVNGMLTPIDLIKCDDEYCFNGCSAGMDAMVANDMSLFKNLKYVSGSMAYKLAVVKNFLKPKIGLPLTVAIDGVPVDSGNYLFAVCSNGSTYGGGYTPAPYANPEDEKLDFALVKKINRLKVPKFLKFYEKGDCEQFPFASFGNCTVMEISSNKPFPVNRDGEIVMKTKVRFELARRAVRLLIPKGAVKKYEEIINFVKNT